MGVPPKRKAVSGLHRCTIFGVATLLFLWITLFSWDVARAGWFASAEFMGVYDDNLNHSHDNSDRKGDIAYVPYISLGNYHQIAHSLEFSVMTEVESRVYQDYSGLNNASAGGLASIKYKWGLGARAPWLKGYGALRYYDYNEGIRDGLSLRAGLFAGQRVNERLDLRIGYEYENFNAHNHLFDQHNNTASIQSGFFITESLQAVFRYSIKRGDIAIYKTPDYWEYDDPFIVDTFHSPMEVYKVYATINTISPGLYLALNRYWCAGLSDDFSVVHYSDYNYSDNSIMASIAYYY